MIVLSVLLLPAMIIRFYQGWFQMLYIDLPLFMASTFSISSFYLVSQRELFPRTWPRALLYLPFLMALGIGLTITNTHAVLEALIGTEVGVRAHSQVSRGVEERPDQRHQVPEPPGLGSLGRTADRQLFRADRLLRHRQRELHHRPFLVLFVVGYWYTGLMSLLQGRFSGLSLSAETHTKPFPVGV